MVRVRYILRLLHSAPAQPSSHRHSNSVLQYPWSQPGLEIQISQLIPSHPTWQAQKFGDLQNPWTHPFSQIGSAHGFNGFDGFVPLLLESVGSLQPSWQTISPDASQKYLVVLFLNKIEIKSLKKLKLIKAIHFVNSVCKIFSLRKQGADTVSKTNGILNIFHIWIH